MGFHSEILEIIEETRLLIKESPPLFASDEDCTYFRALFRTLAQNKRPPIQKPLVTEKQRTVEKKRDNDQKIPQANSEQVIRVEQNRANENKNLVEKAKHIANDPFQDIRALLAKVAPHWPILNDIPNDSKARLLAQRWKNNLEFAPVMILYLNENQSEKTFLHNVAKALGAAHVTSAHFFEQSQQWTSLLDNKELKAIIIASQTLKQLPNLLKLYRNISSQHLIKQTPVIILPDIATFLQNPLSKKSLWETIKQYAPRS